MTQKTPASPQPQSGIHQHSVKAMQIAWAALLLVWVVHLSGQLTMPNTLLTDATQVMLMPLLGAVLIIGCIKPRSRLVNVVLIALFFSWLGDTVPRFLAGETGFLAMVGLFLVAQIFYIAAFWPLRKNSWMSKPVAVTPYGLALGALIALCYDGAGSLLVPVVIYGVALAAMAILATGLGKVAAIGGAIFFISDALIALRSFADIILPAHGFWVMFTYVLGQILLVVAVRNHVVITPQAQLR